MFTGVVADNIVLSYKPLVYARSILIHDGRVVYAGDPGFVEKVVNLFGGDLYDYGSKTIIPGFIDPHIHIDGLALEEKIVDLRNAGSIKEIKELLKKYAEKTMGWIIGRGWDQEKLVEKRYPTRRDLDEVSSTRPVYIIRVCGHLAVANTLLLEKYIDRELFNRKLVDPVNGLVYEDAVHKILDKSLALQELEKLMEKIMEKILSMGITGLGWVSANLQGLLAINRFTERKPWTRIYLEPNTFSQWLELGLPPGTLGVDGVKILLDGSLGARTALLTKPYKDKPDTVGTLNIDPEKLEKIIVDARNNRYHVAVHAIGDKALDILLKTYHETGCHGERIEHASLVRNDQLEKIRELEIHIVIQPGFILSDTWIMERIGLERIKWAYRIKSLAKHSKALGFSSDAPVEPVNPWRNIYAAVSRGEYEELEISRYTIEEKIGIKEALYHHTRGSAKTLYIEDRGCLEPGYWADFIVVDRNPLEIMDPRELYKISILETWVNGEKAWSRQGI